MKSKFSSSAATREPAKGKMMEPLSRPGESTSRPPKPAASDPTRESWDPKMIEDAVESIISKTSVFLALSLAGFATSAWVFHLDPGYPQAREDASRGFGFLGYALIVAIGARCCAKPNFFGGVFRDPEVLRFVNRLFGAFVASYALGRAQASWKLAHVLPEE